MHHILHCWTAQAVDPTVLTLKYTYDQRKHCDPCVLPTLIVFALFLRPSHQTAIISLNGTTRLVLTVETVFTVLYGLNLEVFVTWNACCRGLIGTSLLYLGYQATLSRSVTLEFTFQLQPRTEEVWICSTLKYIHNLRWSETCGTRNKSP